MQLVFVLTKAFIGKVQELTSSDRQGGDKRGPLEITTQMHTQCIQSLVQTHEWLRGKTSTSSGTARLSLSHTNTAHMVHTGMHAHSCWVSWDPRCVCRTATWGKIGDEFLDGILPQEMVRESL